MIKNDQKWSKNYKITLFFDSNNEFLMSHWDKTLNEFIFRCFSSVFIKFWSKINQMSVKNDQKWSKMIKNDQKSSKMTKLCDDVVQKMDFWSQISLKFWKSHFFDGFHRFLCWFDRYLKIFLKRKRPYISIFTCSFAGITILGSPALLSMGLCCPTPPPKTDET